ncbi:MAG: hypothetical protein V2J19_02835 [Wenzhouxiangella sp.]|jgi:hypothetical protein|nr:hypothetical protein [Wenzhouxiangella sp.]
MPFRFAQTTLKLLLCLVGLALSSCLWAQPNNGWGPHYQQCLPQFFDADFGSMTIPGDAVSSTFSKYDDNDLLVWTKELTVWRKACSNDSAYPATFVKVETIERGPADDSMGFWDSLSAENLRVLQGGINSEPHSFASCSNVSACAKSWVEVFEGPEIRLIPRTRSGGVSLANAFTMKIEGTDGSLSVPDMESGELPEEIFLQGSLSGSWFDPDRNGEGLVLEFGESNERLALTVYWFTYLEGRQYWLIGTQSYSSGDTSITVDLLEVSASGFGEAFDPDTVEHRVFGSMSLEFSSCTTGLATWESAIGLGQGEFHLERITGGLHGLDCN